MADDDRYRWLDDEAAERLLRGSAVNARSAAYDVRHGAGHDNVADAPTSAYDGAHGSAYDSARGGGQGGSYDSAYQSAYGAGHERPGAATPSWARGDGPDGAEASVPGRRGGDTLAEDRLAHLLDALVAEQTATLHALGAARTGRMPGDATAELPGEAAAVEAFRAAHPQVSAEHSGTVDITAGPTEASTVVGRRAAARENRRRSRDRRAGGIRRGSLVGRPLRAGFAMAVAGCALGGAAVAAGTGVLPTPFGGNDSPAASVSPLASPGNERDEASGGGGGSPYDGNGPRRGTREGGSPSDSPGGEDLAGTERGRDGNGKGPDKDWWHDGKHLSDAEKKAMARALCQAYENGDLSLKDRVRLETVAGGPEGVKKFCEKNDGERGETGSGGASAGGVGTPGEPGGTGDTGGSAGNDGGDGGGDSGSQDGGDTGGDSGGPGGSRPDSGGEEADGGSTDAGTTSAEPSDDGASASAEPDTAGASATATAGS
ncbi:hypothetical protein [Streptomyces marispadix]|uniref:Uncharacterized protein n=1 Tax=Streptomyces marispadix TaxID=2922868 RepID=A0ABS9T144_9ACTN|nr:hypothetical protein [Streptomyces marispadix]MCH6162193.1 hypothetical protein [Streptomyces marispadix]